MAKTPKKPSLSRQIEAAYASLVIVLDAPQGAAGEPKAIADLPTRLHARGLDAAGVVYLLQRLALQLYIKSGYDPDLKEAIDAAADELSPVSDPMMFYSDPGATA